MRGGAIRPLSNLTGVSSLGAIMGRRNGRFPGAWARRFCITVLVTVIRLTVPGTDTGYIAKSR